jgi:hypothetical protein
MLTDDGDVHVLKTTAYLIPELPCRLFSRQAHFQELFKNGLDPCESANFAIKRNTAETIQSKMKFEQEALQSGMSVSS